VLIDSIIDPSYQEINDFIIWSLTYLINDSVNRKVAN